MFRSDDGGRSWQSVGLARGLIMAVSVSPTKRDVVWVGTEPSKVWRSADAGRTWQQTSSLETLPSSSQLSFPPRPDTHHVRWIACHPLAPKRLWVAIEAGALVSTIDGGRTWHDRVPSGPYDTHEIAIHPKAPDTLRVSAGDGYFESDDAGATWRSPRTGLEVRYLRSVAIDPDHRGSSWSRRLPHRTLRTPPAGQMEGCIDGWLASPGSAFAMAGRSRPAQSRLCSAPARQPENCGPQMSGACIVPMTAARVGAAWLAMRRRRATCAGSRSCGERDRRVRHRGRAPPSFLSISSSKRRISCRGGSQSSAWRLRL
jgi:hypothetical protein